MSSPELSVVLTVVDGGSALVRCLEALGRQTNAPIMEVIVPYDETIAEVGDLADRFPAVQFLPMGTLSQVTAPENAFDAHDLFDRRRAGGLRAARGRLLAMLEDRGAPRSDWARAFVDLHHAMPHAVIGGAVENGADSRLLWAIFFCDFGPT